SARCYATDIGIGRIWGPGGNVAEISCNIPKFADELVREPDLSAEPRLAGHRGHTPQLNLPGIEGRSARASMEEATRYSNERWSRRLMPASMSQGATTTEERLMAQYVGGDELAFR